MVRSSIVAAVLGLGLGLGATVSHAQSMNDLFKVEVADTNKDGMVSRDEFLAAAGKSFDMMAQKMGAKDGKMMAVDYRKYMAEFSKLSPN